MSKRHEKTILITGCSSGIGLCVARGLKQRGYRVFATARREESVAQLESEDFDAVRNTAAFSAAERAWAAEVRRGNPSLPPLELPATFD